MWPIYQWTRILERLGKNSWWCPSTLKWTLPEIYLEDENVSERIAKINSNMKALLDEDFFNEYKDSMIYLERTQSDGKIREGLVGVVDLEAYSYEKEQKHL